MRRERLYLEDILAAADACPSLDMSVEAAD